MSPVRTTHRLAPRLLAIATASVVEAGVVFGLLLLLGAGAFGSHILHGGFYTDDWRNYASVHYAGSFFDAIGIWHDLVPSRPVQWVYLPVVNGLLGANSHLHLAFAMVVATLMSASFFLLLRTLGMRRIHAGAIAALLLVFPLSDATRLWSGTAPASLAMVLYFLGAVVALRGLRHRGGRAHAMHGTAVALYVLAIFTYDLVAPAVPLAVLLYRMRSSWRAVLSRWAVDTVAAVAAVVLVSVNRPGLEPLPIAKQIPHAFELLKQAVAVVSYSAVPYDSLVPFEHRTATSGVLLTAVALVLAGCAGLLALRLLPRADAVRAEVRSWLFVAGFAAVGIGAGYLFLVPAGSGYDPLTYGINNRSNMVAAAGVVTLIYALTMVVATLGFRRVRRRRGLTAATGVLVAIVLAVGYVDRIATDTDNYDRAADLQAKVLRELRQTLPSPPAHAVIYAFGYPNFFTRAVPVFYSHVDLDGAVKALYDDPTLQTLPAVPNVRYSCRDHDLFLGQQHLLQLGWPRSVPYANLFFVDGSRREVIRPSGLAACRRALKRFKAGPSVLHG